MKPRSSHRTPEDKSPPPQISVVIATYNRAHFLRETLDSVFAQGFTDFELIVVDDGSTDDTRELLGSYGPRLRAFYRDNRGPSAARNFGVAQARGHWIAIQDSDDVCAPDYLRILYNAVEGDSDVNVVFANGAYVERKGHRHATIIPAGKSRLLALSGVALADLFDQSIFRLQASLIRKQAYLAVGGLDETLSICHDLDLIFKLYGHGPIRYVDEVVFLYRTHGGNISRNEEVRLSENLQVIENLRARLPEADALLGQRRLARRMAYRYYRLAKARWRTGDRAAGDRALRKAVALRPLFLKYRLYSWGSWVRSRRLRLTAESVNNG